MFCVRIQCDSCKNCGSNSSYFIRVILNKDSPRIYRSTYLRSSFFPLIQQFWHSILSGQRWYKNSNLSRIYPRVSGSKTLWIKRIDLSNRFYSKKKKKIFFKSSKGIIIIIKRGKRLMLEAIETRVWQKLGHKCYDTFSYVIILNNITMLSDTT